MHAGTHCTISMKLPAALCSARMAASRHSTRLAIKAPSLRYWPLSGHKFDQPAKECAPAKKLDQSRLAPTVAACGEEPLLVRHCSVDAQEPIVCMTLRWREPD